MTAATKRTKSASSKEGMLSADMGGGSVCRRNATGGCADATDVRGLVCVVVFGECVRLLCVF